MKVTKENVIKSLKTCSAHLGKCEDCIYFEEKFDTCHNLLCKDALKIIEELDSENKNLKTTLAETTDLARELLYHIGG